jgi:hypothetical protein
VNKILVGVVAGVILGFIDGATAWFTPEVRNMMTGILVGSTFKGLLVGIVAGFYARKVESVPKGILLGSVVGLLLAFAVAAMPDETGKHHYLEIMLPGFITGAIIGFCTQRVGARPAASSVK